MFIYPLYFNFINLDILYYFVHASINLRLDEPEFCFITFKYKVFFKHFTLYIKIQIPDVKMYLNISIHLD